MEIRCERKSKISGRMENAVNECTFAEKYEVTKESLGRGYGGLVETVSHRSGRRKCVLKKIQLTSRKDLKSASKELDVLSLGISHENIVLEGPTLYVIMEKMRSLSKELSNRKKFDERDAAKIIRDVASALEHLHRLNVIHGDVKVGNILISEDKFYPVKLSLSLSMTMKSHRRVKGWKLLSSGARDLISRLLDVDRERRYTAEEVLKHPWIEREGNPGDAGGGGGGGGEECKTTMKRKRFDDDEDENEDDVPSNSETKDVRKRKKFKLLN